MSKPNMFNMVIVVIENQIWKYQDHRSGLSDVNRKSQIQTGDFTRKGCYFVYVANQSCGLNRMNFFLYSSCQSHSVNNKRIFYLGFLGCRACLILQISAWVARWMDGLCVQSFIACVLSTNGNRITHQMLVFELWLAFLRFYFIIARLFTWIHTMNDCEINFCFCFVRSFVLFHDSCERSSPDTQ